MEGEGLETQATDSNAQAPALEALHRTVAHAVLSSAVGRRPGFLVQVVSKPVRTRPAN